MSAFEIAVLAVAGIFAGAMNAIAGGGTFFAFGALTAIGLPPITANATSATAMIPGYVASAINYRGELAAVWRRALVLGAASIAGAVIGALILVALDNATFADLVPWLLMVATAVFAFGPWLTERLPARAHDDTRRRVAATLAQFVLAIYGGFFGAGMGIMMLASLGITEGQDFHRINALKHILSIVIQTTAIAVFIGGGVIAWPQALVLIVAVVTGGWFGVDAARRFPIAWLRAFVIAVGLGLTAYYFVEG